MSSWSITDRRDREFASEPRRPENLSAWQVPKAVKPGEPIQTKRAEESALEMDGIPQMKQVVSLLVLLCLPGEPRAAPADSPAAMSGLAGVLVPSDVISVSPAVDGVLRTVSVELGDLVEAGQIVAVLEDEVEHASVELARLRASRSRRVEMARVEYREAQRRLERNQALNARGIVTDDELETFLAEKMVRKLALEDAEEEQRIAALELVRAEALLQQRFVYSPIRGLVTERLLSPGELASRSGESVILEIACLDPLQVDLHVPVEFLARVRKGMRALVSVHQHPPVLREGAVMTVDRVADAASNTFRVRLEVPNAGLPVAAGLRCSVDLVEE